MRVFMCCSIFEGQDCKLSQYAAASAQVAAQMHAEWMWDESDTHARLIRRGFRIAVVDADGCRETFQVLMRPTFVAYSEA